VLVTGVKGDTRAAVGHVLGHGALATRAVPHSIALRNRKRRPRRRMDGTPTPTPTGHRRCCGEPLVAAAARAESERCGAIGRAAERRDGRVAPACRDSMEGGGARRGEHGDVRCCAVLCGAVRCCAVLCGAVRCCADGAPLRIPRIKWHQRAKATTPTPTVPLCSVVLPTRNGRRCRHCLPDLRIVALQRPEQGRWLPRALESERRLLVLVLAPSGPTAPPPVSDLRGAKRERSQGVAWRGVASWHAHGQPAGRPISQPLPPRATARGDASGRPSSDGRGRPLGGPRTCAKDGCSRGCLRGGQRCPDGPGRFAGRRSSTMCWRTIARDRRRTRRCSGHAAWCCGCCGSPAAWHCRGRDAARCDRSATATRQQTSCRRCRRCHHAPRRPRPTRRTTWRRRA